MKFAVPYYKQPANSWMDQADEIIIKYDNNKKEALIDFLKDHPSQRIIIDVINFDEFEASRSNVFIFTTLKRQDNLSNWALRFDVELDRINEVETYLERNNFHILDENGKCNIDYFYKAGMETFEQLDGLLRTPVSDVYIINSLAFDLERVKEKIQNQTFSPKVRIYPNVCQSCWENIRSIYKFFIRPEDVHFYEKYVDIMEIYAETDKQKNLAEMYLEIYQKNQSWYGDLQEYLINCDEPIYNPYIFKNFGERRVKCQKRCAVNGRCRFCFDQYEYIQLMHTTHNKMINTDDQLVHPNENINIEVEDIKDYIGEK